MCACVCVRVRVFNPEAARVGRSVYRLLAPQARCCRLHPPVVYSTCLMSLNPASIKVERIMFPLYSNYSLITPEKTQTRELKIRSV